MATHLKLDNIDPKYYHTTANINNINMFHNFTNITCVKKNAALQLKLFLPVIRLDAGHMIDVVTNVLIMTSQYEIKLQRTLPLHSTHAYMYFP